MPSLGADMTEGRITEWLVAPGDRVKRGQIVVVVETDKSDIEVEVFQPGVVSQLLVEEGEKVPVGTPIAVIEVERAEAAPAPTEPKRPEFARPAPEPEPAAIPNTSIIPAVREQHVAPSRPPVITSPVVRRLASDLHVDVARVHATGPGGRVHRDDVLAASRPSPRRRITPRARRLLGGTAIELDAFDGIEIVTGADVLRELGRLPQPVGHPNRADSMRQQIAALMARSWAEIPHYHVMKRLDLSRMVVELQARNNERSLADRVLPAAVLLCAGARVAARTPACNGWWRNGHFEPAPTVSLGVILSVREGGIIAPTIEGAEQLTTVEMMHRLSELVQRVRHGRLRGTDLAEASITVSNLGDRGAESMLGVIHPPQVALVGLGCVHDEVWAVDGQPVVCPTVLASLSGDHRASDGLTGSLYLTQLQSVLDTIISEES
jgi:pyruvate dehydrogenase E2 component (dihydrolipoamide acetyltransferase)